MPNPLFVLGWCLLAVALVASAVEMLAEVRFGGVQTLFSAYDLWYALWPSALIRAQIHVERVSVFLWDPLVVGALAVPAWALSGVPGAALAWCFRPDRHLSAEERREREQEAESMNIYDVLARRAREEGYDGADDGAPLADLRMLSDGIDAARSPGPDDGGRGLGVAGGASPPPLPENKTP
jgi:hypothetical protein